MKQLPSGMQAHLNTGTTTLCWCWRVIRKDNTVQGFTDHDRDLTFDNTTYEAATGFTGTELKDTIGLNVDNMDVDGALSSASIKEADLAAGIYDNATVEIYRANWQDVTQRVLMRKGSIGEVRRSKTSFTAELRGLAHHLQQPQGRLYQYTCDANLGDTRCSIDINDPVYKATATIGTVIDERTFTTSDLNSFDEDWFTNGLLTWISGSNAPNAVEVKHHTNQSGTVTIELWQTTPQPITSGNTFEITAGCNKRFTTCRDKFSNTLNFRGFPHMPGNDFALSYPNRDDPDNNGRKLVE